MFYFPVCTYFTSLLIYDNENNNFTVLFAQYTSNQMPNIGKILGAVKSTVFEIDPPECVLCMTRKHDINVNFGTIFEVMLLKALSDGNEKTCNILYKEGHVFFVASGLVTER